VLLQGCGYLQWWCGNTLQPELVFATSSYCCPPAPPLASMEPPPPPMPRVQIAEVLLQYGASVDGGRTDGASPLYLAAQEGHATVAALLLTHGANGNRARVG
jgi:hypothetical protein